MPALTVLSIVIFIFILGVLVTVHEFGHFIAAKKSGIRVFEFAIGMGPKIWKKQKGETLFTIRAIPIGGFCNMGEDNEAEPDDKRAFTNAKRRYQALVLAAGSVMNFLLGFLILLGLNMTYPSESWAFTEPVIQTVEQQSDDPNWSPQLQAGDRILRLNGHALYTYPNFSMFFSIYGDEQLSLLVERDGEKIALNDMQKTTFDGEERYGFAAWYQFKPATLGTRFAGAWHDAVDYTRLVWVSLGELFRGRAKVTDLMGPVGMANMVDAQVQAPNASVAEKTVSILNFSALIAINLAVMNMLPIPALDGSRLLVVAAEGVRRKKLNPKYVGYVHAAGMVLLLSFMAFAFFNDIIRWVTGGLNVS